MATVPPIRQTIKFEGLDEIKQKLADLGGAGEKAFEQLRAASAPAVQSMERLEGALANVQRSMSSVAVTGRQFGTSIREAGTAFNSFEQSLSRTVRSVRNYGAVLAATVAGIALFVRSGIQAGDDIEEQAEALGLSTQAYQELGFAALDSGVKQSQFASGMKFFSQQIQKATQDSAKAMLTFVEGIDKNFDDLGGRIKRVTDVALVPFSTIREAAQNFQVDLASKGINRSLFEIEQGFRKLAAGGAEGRAEFERLGRVSLPAARDGLDVLRDGSEKSIKALNKLLPTFKLTEGGSVDLGEAFLQVADHFKALPDGVQKTALAMAFFGRAAGPQLVPLLNQGSAGIGEFLAKTRELGLQLSGPQIKASAAAARSFDLLARSATNVKNQIGAAFAPVAGAIAGGLTEFLSKNQKAINDFATELNTRATPYIQAFFDALADRPNTTQAAVQIEDLRRRFEKFGESVKRVVTFIGSAFTVILAVLDQVAAGFRAVFGTELTGAELGVILIITKMVGGFALLLASLKLAGSAFSVLNNFLKLTVASGGLLFNSLRAIVAAIVAWPAAIVLVGAALGALLTRFEPIKKAADEVARIFSTLFGFDPTGTGILVGLGAIAAGLLTLRARAVVAGGGIAALGTALGGLARHRIVRILALAAAAITLFGEKLGFTTAESKALGDAAGEAAPKVDTFAAKIIDVKKQVAAIKAQKVKEVGTVATESKGEVDGLTEAIIKMSASPDATRLDRFEQGFLTATDKAAFLKQAVAEIERDTANLNVDKILVDKFTSPIPTIKTLWTDFFDWLESKKTSPLQRDAGIGDIAQSGKRPLEGETTLPKQTAETTAATAAQKALNDAQQQGIATGNEYASALDNVKNATLGEIQAAATEGGMHRETAKVLTDTVASYRILKGGIIEVAEASKQGVAGVDAWKNVVRVTGATMAQIDAAEKQLSRSTRETGQAFKEGVPGVGAYANVLRVVGASSAEIDAAQKQAGASTLPLQERLRATGQAFTEMKATSTAAFTEMKAGSKAAFSEAEAGAGKLERAMGGISALGPATSAPLETVAKNISFVDQAIDGIGAGGVDPFAQIKIGAEGLVLSLQTGATTATTLGTNLTQAGQAGAGAFSGIPATLEGFLATLSRIPQSLTSGTEASTQFGNAFTQAMTGAKSPVDQLAAAVDALMAKFEAAIAKARELASARSAGGGGGEGGGTESLFLARGGPVRGRGTGTSDSNLAWLSRGEYVEPANVVRQPGVLSFLEVLRRSGGDLRSVMERFAHFDLPKFNAGGLADGLNRSLSALMIPRFAAGGLADMAPAPAAAGGRSFTLVLDRQHFDFSGPEDTVARFEKRVMAQQASSTGPKPGWVGGGGR